MKPWEAASHVPTALKALEKAEGALEDANLPMLRDSLRMAQGECLFSLEALASEIRTSGAVRQGTGGKAC